MRDEMKFDYPFNRHSTGTPFEDLPEDWECPECGVSKDHFEKEE